MGGGLVRLREILNEIAPSERKVAEYILAYPEKIIGMSVTQLAKASGGSQAAVIRLCKSMNVKGYQELMLKVAGDLKMSQDSEGYQEIHRQDSIEKIIENVTNNNIQSLRDTVKVLDSQMVEKAVKSILRAERICLFGIGASNLIAIDAQFKFMRINKTCLAYSDPDLQLISAVNMTNEDIAICISYSGETATIIECIRRAKERGATTISITKYGKNSVSKLADIPLYMTSTENEIRVGATSSRITQLNIIDILYLSVTSRDYDNSVYHLKQSGEIIRMMRR